MKYIRLLALSLSILAFNIALFSCGEDEEPTVNNNISLLQFTLDGDTYSIDNDLSELDDDAFLASTLGDSATTFIVNGITNENANVSINLVGTIRGTQTGSYTFNHTTVESALDDVFNIVIVIDEENSTFLPTTILAGRSVTMQVDQLSPVLLGNNARTTFSGEFYDIDPITDAVRRTVTINDGILDIVITE
ncbi:MAG: hypothetical protein AAFX87_22215 [Bacteroidota bacterium]